MRGPRRQPPRRPQKVGRWPWRPVPLRVPTGPGTLLRFTARQPWTPQKGAKGGSSSRSRCLPWCRPPWHTRAWACSSVSPRTPLPRLPCTGRRPATSCRRPHPALPSEGLLGDWGGPQGLCCGGISGRHPGCGGTELCRASLCGRLPFPCIVTLPWWEVSTSELLSGGRVDRRPLQGPFVCLSSRGSSEASFLTEVEVGW